MVAGLVACGNGTPETTPTPATPTPAPVTGDDNGDENGDETAATGEPLIIGVPLALSGAFQDYGEQQRRGMILGLEYVSNGTGMIAGRPVELVFEDTTMVPDVARERTMSLIEGGAEIIAGLTASGDAIAILPLLEEFNVVGVICAAASDAIIAAPNWNPHVFRVGRTSGQDALAMANIIYNDAAPGATVATLAPDTVFGHTMSEPFIAAAEGYGLVNVINEFIPPDATDFTPYLLRIRQAAPDYLYVIWAGANPPWTQLIEMDIPGVGTMITTGAPEIEALKTMLPIARNGGIGFTVYYYTAPQNEPLNDWMVRRHFEDFGFQPDIFVPSGFSVMTAIATALEQTGGNTDPEVLIPTMRGMQFPSPTGMRWFREEDHQAMQVLFDVEFTYDPAIDHLVPVWRRTIPADQLIPPIMN